MGGSSDLLRNPSRSRPSASRTTTPTPTDALIGPRSAILLPSLVLTSEAAPGGGDVVIIASPRFLSGARDGARAATATRYAFFRRPPDCEFLVSTDTLHC